MRKWPVRRRHWWPTLTRHRPRAKRLPDLAQASPAPEASAKVQYRIEDLAPQATSIRKRTEAQPVAMVRSGEPLRRTPAADAASESSTPTTIPSPTSNDEPLMPPSGAVGWPETGDVQPMSGTSDDEPIRLPTPDLLEEVQCRSTKSTRLGLHAGLAAVGPVD